MQAHGLRIALGLVGHYNLTKQRRFRRRLSIQERDDYRAGKNESPRAARMSWHWRTIFAPGARWF